MKGKILSALIVALLFTIIFSGCMEEKKVTTTNVEWEKMYDGNNYSDEARSITTDIDGNIYVVGYTSNASGDYYSDWWIKKFDSNGNEDVSNWNKIIQRKGQSDEALSVATDADGNVYVVGYGFDLCYKGVFSGSNTGEDGWIKKFDSNGNEDTINWNKIYDGNHTVDEALSVATDLSGNVYVAGYSWDIGYSFQIPTFWIKKFDPNGNEDTINWNKTIDNGGYGIAIATDHNENVYFVWSGIDNFSSMYGEIKKFDSNGNQKWNKTYLSNESNIFAPISVAIDRNSNIYVSGVMGKSGETNMDWWIKKFDSNGNEDTINWNKTYDANGSMDMAMSIATDTSGNVYVSGFGTNLTGHNGWDWWIKKFDSVGTQLWNKIYDGNGSDDCAYSVTTDTNGNVYVAGFGENLLGTTYHDWWIKKII